MPKIKNISPFGDLYVPLLGIEFKHGSIEDVTDEQAQVLLMQSDNFTTWGEPAKKARRKAERENEQTAGSAVAPLDGSPEGVES